MELTPQEIGVLEYLEGLIRNGNSIEEAVVKANRMLMAPGLIDKVVAYRKEVARRRRQIATTRSLAEDPEDAPPSWYTGPSADDLFWPAHAARLGADPRWAEALPSLDTASTDIVSLLADPHSPNITTRGLVLGHVQSGKTANFTATIAKAADAGYRLFIVLSGVHNALRRQTQLRLEDELYAPHPTRWLQLTDEQRDFGNPVKALPLVAGTELKLLAVVKKNVSRLTRLKDWLIQAHEHGGLDTCPVLIIDDEADQASPNAAKNAELDKTSINKIIYELLQLPRVAYVGYTATPFANILINPSDQIDIYPRSFIYSLPKPATYFGSEELFGASVTEEDESEATAPHDMIRYVSAGEAASYVVPSKKPYEPKLTESLRTAIRWFVIASAARRARSSKPKHSSMLIHTTSRVDPQLKFLPVVKTFLKELKDEWIEFPDIWRDHWDSEQILEPPQRSGHAAMAFEQVAERISSILGEVRVVADNSQSTERLIYSDEPATVIAVGGNTLSRGLTLEGLICSFFLRSAGQYDSLLQMGRWFGYRPGYEDLPRIWTTQELAADFQFLSEIEVELRKDIDRYRNEQATPLQLPVRIQLHPKLQVTSRLKMQFAVPGEASFSGQRPQTTYFRHRNGVEVKRNQDAARRLVSSALLFSPKLERSPGKIVLRDLPASAILEFVEEYAFHPNSELRPRLLKQYILSQQKSGHLEWWNLAIVTRRDPNRAIDLGFESPVNTLVRSKLLASSSSETASIGTLMSKPDRVADLLDSVEASKLNDEELLKLRTESSKGLILLYPIGRDSQNKPGAAKYREKLDAIDDLIGVAFAFPRAAKGSEPENWIQVDPELLKLSMNEEQPSDDSEYSDTEGDHDDVDLENV